MYYHLLLVFHTTPENPNPKWDGVRDMAIGPHWGYTLTKQAKSLGLHILCIFAWNLEVFRLQSSNSMN